MAGLLLLAFLPSGPAQTKARERGWLEQMLKLFPQSEPWEKWLHTTGELPPDFDALPAQAYLPDPLVFANGQAVLGATQWPARRQELLQLFHRYTLGSVPPPPGNVRVVEDRTRQEGLTTVHVVSLEFGPSYAAKMYLELFVPPGTGPFPVFVTQGTHRGWALMAASRGYIGCAYAGGDNRDDTMAYNGIWPDHDWGKLTRRAWAASRVVDYLYTVPVVDRARIALAGHSRNGKTALIAGALDERFTAVILSSSGAGGACPFRFFSETQFGEGIELLTREFPDWFHPRLRFFAGRENKLPIDQNELVACVAPRPCLIASALNDSVESIWANEQCQMSAQRVYAMLGAPGGPSLLYRPGGHATKAEDIENYFDWLDTQFGHRQLETGHRRLFPTYPEWQQNSGEHWDPAQYPQAGVRGVLVSAGGNPILTTEEWKGKRNDILTRVAWGLGAAPPRAEGLAETYGAEPAPVAALLNRGQLPAGIAKRSITFGNYVTGDLYFPAGGEISGHRLPVVIWLHPISTANGYMAGYRRGEPFHFTLAKAGFAVFAFDQIGNGQRIEEVRKFYSRYPHWSLMGRTVMDVRAAVDAVRTSDFLDPRRILVAGYATGGAAALYAAALDDRIAGVISVAGFTPMRLDTSEKGTGGIARWSHWQPLLPRLGAFIGQEARIPYDFPEIIGAIAPRPAVIMQPQVDYQHTPADIVECLDEARKVYELFKVEQNLALFMANDYNRFSPELQEQVLDQLKRMVALIESQQ